MNIKNIIVAMLCIFIFFNKSFCFVVRQMEGLSYCTSFYNDAESNTDLSEPRVLYIHVVAAKGGGAAQTVTLYNSLFNKGFNINILVAHDSPIAKELDAKNLPYYSTNVLKYSGKKSFKKIFASQIEYICKQRKINLIHCNKPYEYPIVRKVADNLNIGSVANYHSHVLPDLAKFIGFDSFVVVSPIVAEYVNNEVVAKGLNIKFVELIYPPQSEERFLNFKPIQTKAEFFKTNFEFEIKNIPIVVMIANLEEHKSHQVLFEAVNRLIYSDHYPVQVVLAGKGGLEKKLRESVEKLKITEYVHFLGFTSLIPELLYYSDLKVLTSKEEAFGICLVEAALMKKPIIIAKSGGAADLIIVNEKTGLLFEPDNAIDLAKKIKFICQNTETAKKLGQSAYDLVLKKFYSQISIDKFENLYKKIFEVKSNKKK